MQIQRYLFREPTALCPVLSRADHATDRSVALSQSHAPSQGGGMDIDADDDTYRAPRSTMDPAGFTQHLYVRS